MTNLLLLIRLLDEIVKKIPKPKEAVPKFGLPKWKLLPLEKKIPLIPSPPYANDFTRQKIGKQLFKESKKIEFNLNDPHMIDVKFPYNSLHDRYLKCYFDNDKVINLMIKNGFLTKNLDVKCTIKEYNNYRKYLSNLEKDDVKKILKHKAQLDDDKRIIDYADKIAQKDIERYELIYLSFYFKTEQKNNK